MTAYKELVVLIAEDDDGHAELIREGLREAGLCNRTVRFANGDDAWRFVSGAGPGEVLDSHKSYLLLLDINMPRMDGIELLRRIKGHQALKDMPVIMLTTTDDPREVEECYALGCNIYMTKPVAFTAFSDALQRLGLFLQVVRVS